MAFKDPYLNENGVLKNLLGIENQDELDKAETKFSALRAGELDKNPIEGDFDMKHLQAIHKHLFQDVYEWAGEIRSIDISKGNTQFCRVDFMDSFSQHLFKDLAKNDQAMKLAPGAFKNEVPGAMAKHFAEINAMHPFREGNGRAQKTFIGQLAQRHGLDIQWEAMSRKELISASIESMSKEPKQLSKLIETHSLPTEKTSGISRGLSQ